MKAIGKISWFLIVLLCGPAFAGDAFQYWPDKVNLEVGETHTHKLRDGSARTLKLISYHIRVRKRKVEALVEVSGKGKTRRHTLQVAYAGVPVAVNGLWVFGYAWKERNKGFEKAGFQWGFPLTEGKDVGLAVNDARYTFYPDMDKYTYPLETAYHEGYEMQPFLQGGGDGWTHSGYDIGVHSTVKVLAMHDGRFWQNGNCVWIVPGKGGKWGGTAVWFWTHVGKKLVADGAQVSKGAPIAMINISESHHYHMGSKGTFDFSPQLFPAMVWNHEHRDDFPTPRYWLVLGAYGGGMSDTHIQGGESGDLSADLVPRKGDKDKDGSRSWRFGDNYASSVVTFGEMASAYPFSGYKDRRAANSVGYACTYIYSPEDHRADSAAHLKWGCSYGGKVWLNGKSIFDNTADLRNNRYHKYNVVNESPIEKDKHDLPLALKAGWNTLIIKTNHGPRRSTVWLFSAKIGDAQGHRIPGLNFSTRDINLKAAAAGPGKVKLTWQHPDHHGTYVDTYKLDVAADVSFKRMVKKDVDLGRVTEYTVLGLPGGKLYLRVKPYNASEKGGTVYWRHVDVVTATVRGRRLARSARSSGTGGGR